MTREEAREELITFIGTFECPSLEAVEIAIEALQAEPCEDVISRQVAIEALGECPYNWTDTEAEAQAVDDWEFYKATIEALPSANKAQDRPKGEWVYHEDYKLDGECCYECSNCGRMYDYKMNYCGYCGSDNRERNE